jgi:hypothetical protein
MELQGHKDQQAQLGLVLLEPLEPLVAKVLLENKVQLA